MELQAEILYKFIITKNYMTLNQDFTNKVPRTIYLVAPTLMAHELSMIFTF